jgi:uncharacterized protein (DUF952 family)
LTSQRTAAENLPVIFYLMLRSDSDSGSEDQVAAPGDEGFVHCCEERQISDVRRRYFPADEEVVAFAFDPTRLPVETRYEPGAGGEDERFPHVYGALQREFVAFIRACD